MVICVVDVCVSCECVRIKLVLHVTPNALHISPSSPITQAGVVIGSLVVQGHVQLAQVLESLQQAATASAGDDGEEGEDPPLVDEGHAWSVLAAVLGEVEKEAGGVEKAKEMVAAGETKSGVKPTQFLASV